MRNLTILEVLGSSYNLSFRRNLTDLEIELLERLIFHLMQCDYLLPPWILEASACLSLVHSQFKSFFMALSKSSNLIPFLRANFIWKSKAPPKVKALAWLVVLEKVNTNDMLQARRPYKSPSPHWCILCKGSGELVDHLFLHCPITLGLWHKLLRATNLEWVPPRNIRDIFIISFKGLGKSIKGKTLWHIAYFTILWIVLQEKNARIFEERCRTKEVLWGLIHFYASLWASCTTPFKRVPPNSILLSWLSTCI